MASQTRPTTLRVADDSVHAAHDDAYDMRPPFDARLGGALKRLTKRRAQGALRRVLGAVGRGLREAEARGAKPTSDGQSVRRILVVRVDMLGDVVLSLPAVRALRRAYPLAAIDMLVLQSSAGILEGEREDIARVLTYNPNVWRHPASLLRLTPFRETAELIRTLRAAHYDLALSVSGDIGSILTRVSGARRRFGYADEAYPHFLTDTLPCGRYQKHQHEVRYVLDLAQAAGGIVAKDDAYLRLHVVPSAANRICDMLTDARGSTGARGPLIAIHAGARNGQAKRWPPEHFATLIDRLVRDMDALVVLTGAPNEAPLAHAVLRHTRKRVLNLVGKTSLPELVALLDASDLLITGDSGPMHIACAVRTPVVALHGPTDPALSGPTAPDALVLRRTLWCAPCYDASATAECRFGNPVCMKEIAPSIVFAAARRQLLRCHILSDGAGMERDQTRISLTIQP